MISHKRAWKFSTTRFEKRSEKISFADIHGAAQQLRKGSARLRSSRFTGSPHGVRAAQNFQHDLDQKRDLKLKSNARTCMPRVLQALTQQGELFMARRACPE